MLAIEGVTPDRIIYAHPCKSRNFLRYAAEVGVAKMTVDNEEELHKISDVYPNAQILLRIAVPDDSADIQLCEKFGCTPVLAPHLIRKAFSLNLNVIGISFHLGSMAHDPTSYSRAIREVKKLFLLAKELGRSMTMLDMGGGFSGIFEDDIKFTTEINKSLEEEFPVSRSSEVNIISEPGQYFAHTPFSLVCNVIGKTKLVAEQDGNQGNSISEDVMLYTINDGIHGSFKGKTLQLSLLASEKCLDSMPDHYLVPPFHGRQSTAYGYNLQIEKVEGLNPLPLDWESAALQGRSFVAMRNFLTVAFFQNLGFIQW